MLSYPKLKIEDCKNAYFMPICAYFSQNEKLHKVPLPALNNRENSTHLRAFSFALSILGAEMGQNFREKKKPRIIGALTS